LYIGRESVNLIFLDCQACPSGAPHLDKSGVRDDGPICLKGTTYDQAISF